MLRKKRRFIAEHKPHIWLSYDDAALIHRAYHKGLLTQTKLAEMFGVSQPTVNKIVNAKGGYTHFAETTYA